MTAPDRLVSVEIRLKPNGTFVSVVYRTANGTLIDPALRSTKRLTEKREISAIGLVDCATIQTLGSMGSFQRNRGQLYYFETIYDNLQGGKTVAQVISVCDGGHLDYAEVAPPPAQVAPPPIPAPADPRRAPLDPDPEIKKFVDCVNAATVVLAGTSNEPAQTIVDAAAGECGKERIALADAWAERHGVTKSYPSSSTRPHQGFAPQSIGARAQRPGFGRKASGSAGENRSGEGTTSLTDGGGAVTPCDVFTAHLLSRIVGSEPEVTFYR